MRIPRHSGLFLMLAVVTQVACGATTEVVFGDGAGGSGTSASSSGTSSSGASSSTSSTSAAGTGGAGGATSSGTGGVGGGELNEACAQVCSTAVMDPCVQPLSWIECMTDCEFLYLPACGAEYLMSLACLADHPLGPPPCNYPPECQDEHDAWSACMGIPSGCVGSYDSDDHGGCSASASCPDASYSTACASVGNGQLGCTCRVNNVLVGWCYDQENLQACHVVLGCCGAFFDPGG